MPPVSHGALPTSALLARALRGDLAWLAADEFSISTLVEAADGHGVSSLLWLALRSTSGRGVDLREGLATGVRASAARDSLLQRELQLVLTALANTGVHTLVMKGSALAYTVYEQPWLRPRTDTDLLVPHTEIPAATRTLQDCGYARCEDLSSGTFVSHQIAFDRVDQHGVHHVIDLHWKVVNPHVLADSLPFEDLWCGARSAPALGPHARVPDAAASTALACIHRLAHHQGADRLIWLYDLRVLTTAFDDAGWDRLCRLACERRIAGLCLDGLREAREHLGSSLPRTVEEALASAGPGEPSRHYLRGAVSKRAVLANDLTTLKSWRARMRLLREHIIPRPAFIRQRYGVTSVWLLPVLYAHRLVTGVYRWVRG